MNEQVTFSTWTKWEKRHILEQEQGIYLWAIFNKDIPSDKTPADPIQKEVIYIGESCKGEGCFRRRWEPFDKGFDYLETVQADPKHNDSSTRDIKRARRYAKLYGINREPLFVATLTTKSLMGAFLSKQSSCFLDQELLNIPLNPQGDKTIESFFETIEDLLVMYVERRLILFYARKNGDMPLINKE
jgi:hypothetical protein